MIISGTANSYFIRGLPGGHEKFVRKIYNLSDADYKSWKRSQFFPNSLKNLAQSVSKQIADRTGLVPRELVKLNSFANAVGDGVITTFWLCDK
jgi:hypothetical protein